LEIADWLRGLSLERYAETFRDNAIDSRGIARAERGRSRKARGPPRPSQDHAEGDRSASWRCGRKHCGACAGIGYDPWRGRASLKIPPMPSSARIVGLGLKLPAQVAVGQTILGRSSARNAVSDCRNRKWHQSPKNSALSMPILPSTLPKRFSLQRSLSSCMEDLGRE
jgi:hypothetical protein